MSSTAATGIRVPLMQALPLADGGVDADALRHSMAAVSMQVTPRWKRFFARERISIGTHFSGSAVISRDP